MSQPVVRIHWNTEEVESNAREVMDLLARRENAGKEQVSVFYALCIGCQQKMWPRLEVVFRLQIKQKFLKGVPLHLEVLVNPDVVKLTIHHTE